MSDYHNLVTGIKGTFCKKGLSKPSGNGTMSETKSALKHDGNVKFNSINFNSIRNSVGLKFEIASVERKISLGGKF